MGIIWVAMRMSYKWWELVNLCEWEIKYQEARGGKYCGCHHLSMHLFVKRCAKVQMGRRFFLYVRKNVVIINIF